MGRFEAAAIAFTHQVVKEDRASPPWKPDEWSVNQISQPKFLQLHERMAGRSRQHEIDDADLELRQLGSGICHREYVARVQGTRLHG